MLKMLRKNTKKIIWLLVISFIFWGVSSSILSRSKTGRYVGEVFGKKITKTDFNNAYRTIYYSPRMQSTLQEKGEISEDILINSTFQHIAFLKQAKKGHISVSDKEVRDEIIKRFSPQGVFNAELYKRWVANVTGQSLRQYEEGVRSELHVQKLIDTIKNNVQVTDQEIKDYFYKDNRKIKLHYIVLPIEHFIPSVTYENDDLLQFYQINTDKFKTEKLYKLNYVLIPFELFFKDIQVSEEELLEYFKDNKHLYSQDDFDDATLFSSLKDTLSASLIEKKAREHARYAASDLKKSISSINLMSDITKQFNYTFNTTSFISLSHISETIGWSQTLEATINQLSPDKITTVETTKGFTLLNLINIQPEKLIGFKSCEDKVKKLFVKDKSLRIAQEKLLEIRNAIISQQTTLQKSAELLNVNFNKTEFFSQNDDTLIDKRSTYTVFQSLWDKEIGYLSMPIVLGSSTIGLFIIVDIINPSDDEFGESKDSLRDKISDFKNFFEVQNKLTEVLQRAAIKKYSEQRK